MMRRLVRAVRQRGAGTRINGGFVAEAPSDQAMVDLLPNWSSRFPAETGIKAGTANLFEDARATWAMDRLRPAVEGMSVLELGPLEGAHTSMLHAAGAGSILAIEANKEQFLKCLVTKEVMGLTRARFRLGSFVPFVGDTTERFDLVWATGVLYHMRDPLGLLQAIGRITDRVHVWTHYVDPARLGEDWAKPIIGTEIRTFGGRPVTYYRRHYGRTGLVPGFCGGVHSEANWITRADILRQLELDGFREVEIAFETADHPNGPSFALVAQR